MKIFKSNAFISFGLAALILLIVGGFYWYDHPTHFKYNDRFIIGNQVSSIIDKYGKFDKIFYVEDSTTEIYSAGYIVEDAKVSFFGTSIEKYYMIYFKDGIAISVVIMIGGWGG
ncbi:MAG: hypothetical protein HGB31_08655 [Erysipelotrichaceae bacterium]|nr:hypothetical protein [Erysipelotrichaceae bacterium]